MERMSKEAVVTQFEVPFWYLPEETTENHQIFYSGQPVSETTYELGTFRMCGRNITHSVLTFKKRDCPVKRVRVL